MQLCWAIEKMVPNANSSNYTVTISGDGSWSITRWDLTDTKPTIDDVTNYWNTNMMDYLRDQKKSELDTRCDESIMGGFPSSALGVAHTYPSDFTAMVYFNATLNRFMNDPTFTTANQKTVDAGYLSHTKEQFIKVFNDGHAFGEAQIAHLNTLKAQVDTATTEADIDAITW